ncbi:MAG TPA: hypothetical protein PLP85_13700, partial [Alcaligenes sp.]|nr:hypothetical protein [Alcaligenes sp.]
IRPLDESQASCSNSTLLASRPGILPAAKALTRPPARYGRPGENSTAVLGPHGGTFAYAVQGISHPQNFLFGMKAYNQGDVIGVLSHLRRSALGRGGSDGLPQAWRGDGVQASFCLTAALVACPADKQPAGVNDAPGHAPRPGHRRAAPASHQPCPSALRLEWRLKKTTPYRLGKLAHEILRSTFFGPVARISMLCG